MKTTIKTVLDNWDNWTLEKQVLQEPTYVLINGQKLELYAISRYKNTLSYVDSQGSIHTIPIVGNEIIIVDESLELEKTN